MGSPIRGFIGAVLVAASFLNPVTAIFGGKLAIAMFAAGANLLSTSVRGPLTQQQQGIQQNVTSTEKPLPVIYGRAKIGVAITDIRVDEASTDDRDLYWLGALCVASEDGSGIAGVEKVWLDERLAIDAPTGDSNLPTETGVQDAFIRTLPIVGDVTKLFYGLHLGSDAQVTDTELDSVFTAYSSTDPCEEGKGIAYLALKLIYDSQIYPNGIPNVTAQVKGQQVYDPRSDTWGWSDNPALCALDYLASKRYGLGADYSERDGGTESEIDEQSFIDAANYFDELVSTPAGNQKRATCNGIVFTDDSIGANLQALLSAGRGQITYEGGKFRYIVHRVTTAETFELSEDNIVGDIEFMVGGTKETANRMVATFIDPDRNWQPDDVSWPEPDQANAFLTNDGDFENVREIDLPFTTDRYMALQQLQVALRESRADLGVGLTAKEEALKLRVGSLVKVTHSDPGWSEKEFWVNALAVNTDGTVRLILEEYDATAYSLDALSTADSPPDTSLPDPHSIAAPTGLTLTSDATTALATQDGAKVPRIKVEWTDPEDPFLDHLRVEFKVSTDSEYEIWNPGVQPGREFDFIWPVTDGETYDVQVVAVNSLGVESDPATAQVTVGTENPTSITLQANFLLLDWPNDRYWSKQKIYASSAVQSLNFELQDAVGTVLERYDLNVTPDAVFEGLLQDVALDAIDPSGSPKVAVKTDWQSWTLTITPYNAADGAQGSGSAGSPVVVVPGGSSDLPEASREGAVLVADSTPEFAEAEYLFERTEPASRSFLMHPGTDGGAGQTAVWGNRIGAASSGALVRALRLENTGAESVGTKVGLPFYNKVTTTGLVETGRIEVGMTDVGQSTYGSDMIFYVAGNGGLVEAGRWNPDKSLTGEAGFEFKGESHLNYAPGVSASSGTALRLGSAALSDDEGRLLQGNFQSEEISTSMGVNIELDFLVDDPTGAKLAIFGRSQAQNPTSTTVFEAAGVVGNGNMSGAGTLTWAVGVRGAAGAVSGAGTVTNAVAVKAGNVFQTSGTVTNAYGFYAQTPLGGTTKYDVYLEATGDYAIWSDGQAPVILGAGTSKAGAANTGYILDVIGIHDLNRPTVHAYSEIQAAAAETVQALEGHAVASHSTGTVTQAIGTMGFAELTAGGTVDRVVGVRGGALVSGNGTVTEAIGVEARAAEILGGASPTITEAISLMVRSGTAGTTNWAIVSEGDSKFEGDVVLSATSPRLRIEDTDGTADQSRIDITYAGGNRVALEAYNDAGTFVRTVASFFHGGSVDFNGALDVGGAVTMQSTLDVSPGALGSIENPAVMLRGGGGDFYALGMEKTAGGENFGFVPIFSTSPSRLDIRHTDGVGSEDVLWDISTSLMNVRVAADFDSAVTMQSTLDVTGTAEFGNTVDFGVGGVEGRITWGGAGFFIGGRSGNNLILRADEAEKARLTTAGHLALGTTDVEAWHTDRKAIEFPYAAIYTTADGVAASYISLAQNAYRDSEGFKYKRSSFGAAIAFASDGVFNVWVAPSGTADTAITWTDALTIQNDGDAIFGANIGDTSNRVATIYGVDLDLSGDAGIRNTSPEAFLHVGDEAGSPFATETLAGLFEASTSSGSGTVRGTAAYLETTSSTTATHIAMEVRGEATHGSGTVAGIRGLSAIGKLSGAGTVTDLRGVWARAWASAGTVTNAQSILGASPLETDTGAITNAYTAFLQAPSSVGSTLNITLWLDDPSGTGANTIEAASGAKLTTGGVWTDAPSFSWLKSNVQPIDPSAARDALLAMQPILYDRTGNGEPGMGFALDHLPEWLGTLDGRRPYGPTGVVPMEFATLAIAGWQDHESRISRLEAMITD